MLQVRGFLALLFIVLSSVGSRAGDLTSLTQIQSELTDLIERIEPSVVTIVLGRFDAGGFQVLNPIGVPAPVDAGWNKNILPDDPNFVPERFGAGVVVADPSGEPVILTNQHVISDGPFPAGEIAVAAPISRIYVRLSNGRGFFAKVHSADPRSELAVIVPEKPSDVSLLAAPIPIATQTVHKKGEIVFVFGNPYGIARDGSSSVAWGLIGNVARRPAPIEYSLDQGARMEETIHHFGTLLQLDCRTDLGFSGGAVVNINGELIGITTALAALEGFESTAGFAIPVDSGMENILESLLRGHEAEYGFLGVGPSDLSLSQMQEAVPDWPSTRGGVQIDLIRSGSAGDRAGIEVGDFVVSLNGVTVNTSSDLFREIGLSGPDSTVRMELLRADDAGDGLQRLNVDVVLDKWPVVNDAELISTVPRREPWNGLQVDFATSRARFINAELDPYPEGVVVLEADDAEIGLKQGDFIVSVNGTSVSSPKSFYTLVRDAEIVKLRLSDGRELTVQ